jgi:hypothetical protein
MVVKAVSRGICAVLSAFLLFFFVPGSPCFSQPAPAGTASYASAKDKEKKSEKHGKEEGRKSENYDRRRADEDEDGDHPGPHPGKPGPWDCSPCERGGDPFADGFINFHRGRATDENRGRPADALGAPDVRPPHSNGLVSLGIGGEITLVFKDNYIFNGPGVDFVVYGGTFSGQPDERAKFFVSSKPGGPFVPIRPVHLRGRNIHRLEFDLAGTGLDCARLLKIVDDGDRRSRGNGFDLDAAEAVHSCAGRHPWPGGNDEGRER